MADGKGQKGVRLHDYGLLDSGGYRVAELGASLLTSAPTRRRLPLELDLFRWDKGSGAALAEALEVLAILVFA